MTQHIITETVTADTGEHLDAVPHLPHGQLGGTGYGWMALLEGTGWEPLANWGAEGWDAGAWPLIVLATTITTDQQGRPIHGLAVYVEGDTSTSWYRDRAALYEAITETCHFHWKMGQSHGPADLPEHAPELPVEYFSPYQR